MGYNRLTKGRALVTGLTVGTDLQVLDDTYINGHLGVDISATDIADGTSMTYTATNWLAGIITGTPTANRALTTPTAAEMIAAVTPTNATGIGVQFTVINLAAATYKMTLTAGTGVTIVGNADVPAASSGTFVARIASATAVTIYRI